MTDWVNIELDSIMKDSNDHFGRHNPRHNPPALVGWWAALRPECDRCGLDRWDCA